MSTAPALEQATRAVPWGDARTLGEVRPAIRELLESSKAFADMTPDEREQLARETVKVATYMANPEGLAREDIEGGGLAEAQADATEEAKKRAASSPGFAGKDFQAGAVKQGVEQFGQLVQKVDFPAFVAGLIKGVFQAIVDSSIQQMRAYGELIANVAKTVDQYAQDNISENNARDFLAQKYPDGFGVTVDEGSTAFAEGDPAAAPQPQPRLQVTAAEPEAFLQRVSADMQLTKQLTDLTDEAQERELVHSARLQIAKGRQQLLASMVMLGINRIVVTDGLINAKVVFDMRASDTARRAARASMYDSETTSLAVHQDVAYDSWFSPVSAHQSIDARNDHVATVQSSLDETSTSQAEVKAKLTGEVRVNFKSDYLPLEKMANPAMIAAIQGNATPLDTTATVQRPAGAPAGGAPAAR